MPGASVKMNRSNRFHPLQPIYQFFGIANVILKRQRHYLVLSLLALINIILAVGLINNASFFSQAVDRVVLLQELKAFSNKTGRPPLSTSIYVFPTKKAPITLQTAEQIADHISGTLSSEVGLPTRLSVTQVSSGGLMLKPSPDSSLFAQGKEYLGNIEVVYIQEVADHIEIIDGEDYSNTSSQDGVLKIWMHDLLAQSMGINVGEKMLIGPSLVTAKTTVQVAGIWKAKDPSEDFWFTNPDIALKSSFIASHDDYINFIQPIIASGAGEASWYVILNENQITPNDGEKYLNGFERAQLLIAKYVPGSRMNTPPRDPLKNFVGRSSALTILLLGYNLPAFGILLYFLVLTSAVMAQWQRRETVMLVSRGLSTAGILNLTLIEQLLLFVVGYPLGILFGMLIARAMGYTASFLNFIPRSPLPVSLEGLSLPLTVLALAFALISRLLPALQTIKSSLVTEERERARPMRKPFWFRTYMDLILIIPTYYAYDQMVKRGTLAALVTDRPEDLYRDPLLVVVPALFILTASLVTVRLFSLFMRLVDIIASQIPWVTIHLALRQLGRQSLDYVQPMVLVIISLAMGVYTMSMASSLDQWGVDRIYYKVGADYTFTPMPMSDETVIDGSWIPLPQDFSRIEGVQAATRVGSFSVRITPAGGKEMRARMLAIDRIGFPAVAWFRPDFANEPLGSIMNRLAAMENALIVPQKFLEENNLHIGDSLPMVITIENFMSLWTEYTIAGTYLFFPNTVDDSILVVSNLDYLSTLTGLTVSHNIWLKTEPTIDHTVLKRNIEREFSIRVEKVNDSALLINEEQSRMERVGIFGTLTIGFLATALMAILGLLIYSYASLQERAYRLAVLNAVGLTRNQLLGQVIIEYLFLALAGTVLGAVIGISASNLFVPFFQFTGEKGAALPPLLPVIVNASLRNLGLIFSGTVIGVELLTIATLLNRRLSQILKRVWI